MSFIPEFSIITPTWNRLYTLRKFFPALNSYTDWSKAELIVIEQGSESEVRRFVVDQIQHIPQFRLFCNQENVGIPRAWNLGLSVAQGKILICIGSDVEVCEGWLEELRRLLTFPAAGCVSIPSDYTSNAYGLDAAAVMEGPNGVRAIEAPGNTGDMLVFLRSTFRALGYFNEEYGLYGEEDADFGFRVHLIGLKNLYSASMRIKCVADSAQTGPYAESRMDGLLERVRMREANQAAYSSGTRSVRIERPF